MHKYVVFADTLSRALLGDRTLEGQSGIQMTTECDYDLMRVTMHTQRPFAGYLFAKNRFHTCRVDVTGLNSAQLTLTFPLNTVSTAYSENDLQLSQYDCGTVELVRMFVRSYSFCAYYFL